MNRAFLTLSGCLLLICGCQTDQQQKSCPAQLTNLQQEKIQLTKQLDKSQTNAKRLQKQLDILRSEKVDENYTLSQIKLTRYTNLYDKNKDGKKETLIVYIQPIDKTGDIIKAPGAVEVELWDLNRQQNDPLLAKWKVDSSELSKLWFSTVITQNYRLTFDVSKLFNKLPQSLTAKIRFTDYNTARVFEDQRVLTP